LLVTFTLAALLDGAHTETALTPSPRLRAARTREHPVKGAGGGWGESLGLRRL
jgi:hypothetical protein